MSILRATLLTGLILSGRPAGADQVLCGTHPELGEWIQALHRSAGLAGGHDTPIPDAAIGQVAVLQDRGDLLVRKNLFDLEGRAVRFVPSPNGYGVLPLAAQDLDADGPLLLGPGEERRTLELPFDFPFFGRLYRRVLVEADGHLAFEGVASPGLDHSLPRLLAGPPTIAAFYADFDIRRGGRVSARTSAGRAVITWMDLPGAGQINRNAFQATLDADGGIEIAFGRMETREGITGLSPGAGVEIVTTDLSSGAPAAAGPRVEAFRESERLDLVSAVRRFYRTYADRFDQLVVYTTRGMNPLGGSFAFQMNVRNSVTGIGLESLDTGADWGSAAALESVVFMDSIEPYRDVDGFEVLGHEVSHRWLARLRYRDAGGRPSDRLLGGDRVHWSFFLDSDASLIGGNDIDATADGFETVDFARRFSALDQYAMGLRLPAEVPPFVLVEDADHFRPNRAYRASSSPEAGVRFSGRAVTVTIEDIMGVMGPRTPDATRAPRRFRQAYLLVGDETAPATAGRAAVVDRIRRRFQDFFHAATGGRGSVETELR